MSRRGKPRLFHVVSPRYKYEHDEYGCDVLVVRATSARRAKVLAVRHWRRLHGLPDDHPHADYIEWLERCRPGSPFRGLRAVDASPLPLGLPRSRAGSRLHVVDTRICRHHAGRCMTGCQRRAPVAVISGYGVCDCVGQITPGDLKAYLASDHAELRRWAITVLVPAQRLLAPRETATSQIRSQAFAPARLAVEGPDRLL